MAANVEIKLALPPERHRALVSRLIKAGAEGPTEIEQTDYFFAVPIGRLKLRLQRPGPAELIAYKRGDRNEPRLSDYLCYRTQDPHQLKEALLKCLPLRGIVHKRRSLFTIRQTRVHIDQVTGVGWFVELETVVGDRPVEAAKGELEELLDQLGLRDLQPVAVAYIDLLTAGPTSPPPSTTASDNQDRSL